MSDMSYTNCYQTMRIYTSLSKGSETKYFRPMSLSKYTLCSKTASSNQLTHFYMALHFSVVVILSCFTLARKEFLLLSSHFLSEENEVPEGLHLHYISSTTTKSTGPLNSPKKASDKTKKQKVEDSKLTGFISEQISDYQNITGGNNRK